MYSCYFRGELAPIFMRFTPRLPDRRKLQLKERGSRCHLRQRPIKDKRQTQWWPEREMGPHLAQRRIKLEALSSEKFPEQILTVTTMPTAAASDSLSHSLLRLRSKPAPKLLHTIIPMAQQRHTLRTLVQSKAILGGNTNLKIKVKKDKKIIFLSHNFKDYF